MHDNSEEGKTTKSSESISHNVEDDNSLKRNLINGRVK